jgi:4-carboxymuconolactone decarboxylase
MWTTNRPRSERFERGLATRREVLGSEYADRSMAQADDFSWPMQVFTPEACWDAVWNRPGLDLRSRSILNLGRLAAASRPHEFRLQLRGALNSGLTKDELKEAFLQIGVYCGVPAAMDAFPITREVFAEMGVD